MEPATLSDYPHVLKYFSVPISVVQFWIVGDIFAYQSQQSSTIISAVMKKSRVNHAIIKIENIHVLYHNTTRYLCTWRSIEKEDRIREVVNTRRSRGIHCNLKTIVNSPAFLAVFPNLNFHIKICLCLFTMLKSSIVETQSVVVWGQLSDQLCQKISTTIFNQFLLMLIHSCLAKNISVYNLS